MQDNPEKFLEVALEAVKKAEPFFCASFGKASGVVEKKENAHRSLITDVDKEIERIITKHLVSRFPLHSISGEELPAQKKQSPYTWYIDPIDGTVNYVRGLFPVSISLGLWKDDKPLVGVVFDPMHMTLYSGVQGQGAFKNGKEKLRVSSASTLGESMGTIGRTTTLASEPTLQRVAKKMYRGRVYGSGALELCYIAEGKLDAMISERIKIFDVAAGIRILTEAGGKATNWHGKTFNPLTPQIVASNGKIHDEILKELKG